MERVLIFSRTKHGADRIVKQLAQTGIPANAIHGNKSQGQRERALGEFRSGKTPILIATDVAARGIDVSGVSHVINFDLPNVSEQYVHRIGRTARAGAAGVAVAYCAEDERPLPRPWPPRECGAGPRFGSSTTRTGASTFAAEKPAGSAETGTASRVSRSMSRR